MRWSIGEHSMETTHVAGGEKGRKYIKLFLLVVFIYKQYICTCWQVSVLWPCVCYSVPGLAYWARWEDTWHHVKIKYNGGREHYSDMVVVLFQRFKSRFCCVQHLSHIQ